MSTLNDLKEAIASVLAETKSYELPSICSRYGLKDGSEDEAFTSKRRYILSRIADKTPQVLLELAEKIQSDYSSIQLGRAINACRSESYRVSLNTRQRIIDEFILLGIEESKPLSGKLELVEFLERIWPLDKMPSTDYRYSDAAGDIRQHMVFNNDWTYRFLFDTYLGLTKGPDAQFLRFLEELVHPLVRSGDSQNEAVGRINRYLANDKFHLCSTDQVSGYPIFRAMRIEDGVIDRVKNLIFAANGPKPEIVLDDSVSNNIRVVLNQEFCLIYDKPIPNTGLLWSDMIAWWAESLGTKPTVETERSLYKRLFQSLGSKPEQILFSSFFATFRPKLGERLPALIPQVYLHYDPYTSRQLDGNTRLPRQRMDFLLLPSEHHRIVIEVDGKQHYADADIASPLKYAAMVSEDRRLKLMGYEVYRFGGYELDEKSGKDIVETFFRHLFKRYSVTM